METGDFSSSVVRAKAIVGSIGCILVDRTTLQQCAIYG